MTQGDAPAGMGCPAPASMTPSEAFAAIALVAVACDGTLGRDEASALRAQLDRRSPYRDLSVVAMGEMFDGLLSRLRHDGWETLLADAVHHLTPEQQETAFAMASQLVHVDGIVDPKEAELLRAMAAQLQLPVERSRLIVEVIAVLNRDSLAS
jgi:hypothetical protein